MSNMNELQLKAYIMKMLDEGFVISPCNNPDCENLFASDVYCVVCDDDMKNKR